MNLYSYLPLTALFANLFLCFYLIYINPKNKLNQIYGLVTFSLSAWSLANFYMFSSSSSTQALFWNSFGTLGAIFTSIFLFQFTIFFCDIKRLKNKVFLVFLYILGSILFLTEFSTNLFTKEMQPSYWGYVEVPGMLYPVLSIFVILFVALSIGICYTFYKKTTSDKNKKQTKYVIIAFLIPLIGGILSQVIALYLEFEILPLTSTLTTFTASIIAFSVFKHNLFKPKSFSIQKKLIAGFLIIALLSGVIGYFSVTISQEELQKEIGANSVLLAKQTLDKIDRDIYNKIEEFQYYCQLPVVLDAVNESNLEFEKLENIQDYIDEKDLNWTSEPNETITPFMQGFMNNTLAIELTERMEFHCERYGHEIISEAFITNKYGANMIQTGKTSDYYQADEEWWQEANETGLYVGDVEYDDSSNAFSISICLRIDDQDDNFLGVMKVVLNIDEIIGIVKELETEIGDQMQMPSGHKTHETMHFRLLTGDNRIIYKSEEHESNVLEPISEELLYELNKTTEFNSYFISGKIEPEQGIILFAHARSEGYREYTGLGWIFVIEHKTEEIFESITDMQNLILTITCSIAIISFLFGFIFSRSISKPIIKLKEAALKMSKGDLNAKIEIDSKDEIGDLASSFKYMAVELKKQQENLEEQVIDRTKELQKKIEELEQYKKVTVGRELKMAELKKEIKKLESNKETGGKNFYD